MSDPARASGVSAQAAAAGQGTGGADQVLAAYSYDLPEKLIAQQPPSERTRARLMPIAREDGHRIDAPEATISDLGRWLRPGDLLVVNATRVIPARLRGHKASGGRCEALLLDAAPLAPAAGVTESDPRPRFRALIKSSGRLRVGLEFVFDGGGGGGRKAEDGGGGLAETALAEPAAARAELVALAEDGTATLAFEKGADPFARGEAPLPPYIRRPGDGVDSAQRALDLERYQTVFAREPGAVAAPTAGLHLTEPLLAELADRDIECEEVVLHVGLGTFRPLRPEDIEAGRLHVERFELPERTAQAIARTRARGGRVIAVGTTTTRVLEHCADGRGGVRAARGETDLFLKPGSKIQVVDGLLTNFHLPGSSLLMLVAAFIGREPMLAAYQHAVAEGFRFFSYGDAMLIVPGTNPSGSETLA